MLDRLLALQEEKAPAGEAFYPDANGCLRLSAGHVEGYKAADAVTHTPLTTLAGLVDKHVEAALTAPPGKQKKGEKGKGSVEDLVQGGSEFGG